MSNLILPVPYSNLMAPPWRLPNFETRQVPLRWSYGGTFTVLASTLQSNVSIPMNGDADFECRELAFYVSTIPGGTATTPGSIRIRFKNSLGKRLSSDLLAIEDYEGPMPISMILPRSSKIYMDIQNIDVNDLSVQVILKGVELFEPLGINRCMPGFEPEKYIPMYDFYSVPPDGWHDEPFDYYFPLTCLAGTRKTTPLPMDPDADFYWRGITGFDALNNTALQTLRFVDAFGNQLSQGYVVQANALGAAPFARSLYPEVCCPANSVMTVDQVEYVNGAFNAEARIALRGVKRFRD